MSAPRFLLLLTTLMIISPATMALDAKHRVEQLHSTLTLAMQENGAHGCARRLEILAPVLAQAFDYPFIARQILRRERKSFALEQSQQFLSLLEKQILLAYAIEFFSYDQQHFEIQELRRHSEHTAMVIAKLKRPKVRSIEFKYFLRAQEQDWKIINVIVDGISDLAVRSAQYRTIIRDKEVEGLLAALLQQVNKQGDQCKSL